jgi:peptide chain release factor 1
MLQQKLEKLTKRHQELSDILAKGDVAPKDYAKLTKELSDLTPVVAVAEKLKKAHSDIVSLNNMLLDSSLDKEFKDMIDLDLKEQKKNIEQYQTDLKILLIPKDSDDERNVIMEIRAGTGGEEASLFAADLLRMYQRYSAVKGWKVDMLSASDTGLGGMKEVTLNISGKGVYARLKFESGVHRVQRVPETEAGGRVHTSAATVAVLPEVEEVDITIDEKDLQIDVYRASGAGGQHVNTTDSAVRITHIPTGVVVCQQDERSQHKNKAKALKILRARIYEAEKKRQDAERASERKSQVGSGDRSERIRTYNYPQGRVSDHRINLTLYKLDQIMLGEAVDEIIDALTVQDQADRLADMGQA